MVLKALKKSDISCISIKLVILYFFNVTDLLLTKVLLQTGMFVEANIVMNEIINDAQSSALIKIMVPLVLIIILRYRLQGASGRQLAKVNILINIVLIFYTVVNSFHIIWIITFYIMI